MEKNMQFWDQMQDKRGFDEGNSTPHGIEVFRKVYCDTMNALLSKKGLQGRFVPYDSESLHNSCLILAVSLDDFKHHHAGFVGKPTKQQNEFDDEFMQLPEVQDAITEANELEVDNYVHVTVSIDQEFNNFLNKLS